MGEGGIMPKREPPPPLSDYKRGIKRQMRKLGIDPSAFSSEVERVAQVAREHDMAGRDNAKRYGLRFDPLHWMNLSRMLSQAYQSLGITPRTVAKQQRGVKRSKQESASAPANPIEAAQSLIGSATTGAKAKGSHNSR